MMENPMMENPMMENPMMEHPMTVNSLIGNSMFDGPVTLRDYGVGIIGDTIIEYNFGFVLDLSKRRNG